MRKSRIKNSLSRLWGPNVLHYLPVYRRAMNERVELLNSVPSMVLLNSYLKKALVSSRITAYLSIRKHKLTQCVPLLLQQLTTTRRFIERVHIYATLRTLGCSTTVSSSPESHRWLFTTEGPRQLEHSCEERNSRMKNAVNILLESINDEEFNVEPELVLRGLSRKQRLVYLQRIGLTSSLECLPDLVKNLFRTDIDPGHGFAFRETVAEAIGRIGFPVGVWLSRALTQEALEFEGRPGSGLGIQRPVRCRIINAFGESEPDSSEFLSLICGYLANNSGSATGGFFLESMNVLWKWRHPELLRFSSGLSQNARLNSLSVCTTYADLNLDLFNEPEARFIKETNKLHGSPPRL